MTYHYKRSQDQLAVAFWRDMKAEDVALRLWRDCFEDGAVMRGEADAKCTGTADAAWYALLAAVREYLEEVSR
jgi:hypothetical protein